MAKYEFLSESKEVNGVTVRRIRALKDIPKFRISKGSIGGFLENDSNLSHLEGAWVDEKAVVFGQARVAGNAFITDNAMIYDSAEIFEEAYVGGNAEVYGDARVFGNVTIWENVKISGKAEIKDSVEVIGKATIKGNAKVSGKTNVAGNARIGGNSNLSGKCYIKGYAVVWNAVLSGTIQVKGKAKIQGKRQVTLTGTILIADESKIVGNVNLSGWVSVHDQCCVKDNVMVDATGGNLTLRGAACIEEFVHLTVNRKKTILNETLNGDSQLIIN